MAEPGPDFQDSDDVLDIPDTFEQLRSEFEIELLNGETTIANAVRGGNKDFLKNLLEKFKPLLVSDIKAYSSAIGRVGFLQYDPTYLEQLIEIGSAHLQTENGRKFINYSLNEVGSARDYLQDLSLLDRVKTAFHKAVSLAQVVAKKDAVILVTLLKLTAVHYPDLLPVIDRGDLKGKILEDSDFYTLVKTATSPDRDPEVAVMVATEILLQSQEQPFGTLPQFTKIAQLTLARYPKHKNDALVDLILRRGKAFMEEDAQTAEQVNGWITESGYKKP